MIIKKYNGAETLNGNDYFNYQVKSDTSTHNISAESSGSAIFQSRNIEHFDTMTIKFSAERLIAQQATYRMWQPLKHNKRLPKKTIYAYGSLSR